MTPDILREVEAIGGQVWMEGERVKYRLPADRCDLLDRLRERKTEIVAALARPPSPPDPIPDIRQLTQRDQTVMAAAHAFHNHLFGLGRTAGCCNARSGRYCQEDAQLRGAYDTIHHNQREPQPF